MLGANINMYTGRESITISANTLARNYEKVLALIEEILFEPRWDEEEFDLAKTRTINNLKQRKADPNYISSQVFNKLLYGDEHIFSISSMGTEESVEDIVIDDLKNYYNEFFSPSSANLHIVGNIEPDKVMKSLQSLDDKWQAKEVLFPEYDLAEPIKGSKIYFVDVPGAKQSVIRIGYLALARSDNDYFPATVMNYKLGGSFNGVVNMILREEKGFTYGARTGFSGSTIPGAFAASSSVRSNATLESVQIFKSSMEEYREGISDEDLEFTKNALIKSNALEFETIGSMLYMLNNLSTYGLPVDYVKKEEQIIRDMTHEEHMSLAQKYINPDKMFYLIVGDAATQLEPLKEIGFGDPVLIKY